MPHAMLRSERYSSDATLQRYLRFAALQADIHTVRRNGREDHHCHQAQTFALIYQGNLWGKTRVVQNPASSLLLDADIALEHARSIQFVQISQVCRVCLPSIRVFCARVGLPPHQARVCGPGKSGPDGKKN